MITISIMINVLWWKSISKSWYVFLRAPTVLHTGYTHTTDHSKIAHVNIAKCQTSHQYRCSQHAGKYSTSRVDSILDWTLPHIKHTHTGCCPSTVYDGDNRRATGTALNLISFTTHNSMALLTLTHSSRASLGTARVYRDLDQHLASVYWPLN